MMEWIAISWFLKLIFGSDELRMISQEEYERLKQESEHKDTTCLPSS